MFTVTDLFKNTLLLDLLLKPAQRGFERFVSLDFDFWHDNHPLSYGYLFSLMERNFLVYV